MLYINIKKTLGEFALNINKKFELEKIYGIFGPSGSGKSSFFRVIAGLEDAKGIITFNNEIWLDNDIFLPPQKREIGYVFQDLALYPHMNVKEQLLFVKNDPKLLEKIIEITKIQNLQKRTIFNLSGGEKQRVAIARALMKQPKILLLDESFTALDDDTRFEILKEIKNIHNELKLTTFIISHQKMDFYYTDKIFEFKNGRIVDEYKIKYFEASSIDEISKISGKKIKIRVEIIE